MLDEALQVIKSLLANDRTDFDGKFYQIKNAPLDPKPVQSPLPIMIGGGGEKVTLRLTAKYAEEWNVWGLPQVLRQKMAILDQHCADVGRDPKAIERSAVAMLMIEGLNGSADAIRKAKSSDRPVVGGTIDDIKATIAEYQETGVTEFIVPDFNMGVGKRRTAVMDAFINDIAPSFR